MSKHPHKKAVPAESQHGIDYWLGGVLGLGFALVLLKAGSPVVIKTLFDAPKSLGEALLIPWPQSWAQGIVLAMAVFGALTMRSQVIKPKWVFAMPAIWLGWQFVAWTKSVDPELSGRTLRHMATVVVSFYLGWLVIGRLRRQQLFWWVIVGGFGVVLMSGFFQRYGELQEMKAWVEENERTHWKNLPVEDQMKFVRQGVLVQTPEGIQATEEFLKRVRNGRVYATFSGYPNALAGAVLLLLPVVLASLWQLSATWETSKRQLLVGVVAYMGLMCLVWSGSKAGWLVFLAMGVVVFWRLPIPKAWRQALIAGVVVVGLGAFAFKFASYFKKGATSVGARVACWNVAFATGLEHPILGTGPGTFGRIYQLRKAPDAEMAQLAHNDYLEQICDSGFVGFLSYLAILPLGLVMLYRKSSKNILEQQGAVWLGLAGWSAQGVLEFSLYIPALACLAFMLLGWLWASSAPKD